MIERGRGSTGTGRPAATPSDEYRPAMVDRDESGDLTLHFVGEDGRTTEIPIASFPLPGWHEAVLSALEIALGPAGDRRTVSSAKGFVGSMRSVLGHDTGPWTENLACFRVTERNSSRS